MRVGKCTADELRQELIPSLNPQGLYLDHYFPSDGTLAVDFLLGRVRTDIEDFSRELSLTPLLTVVARQDGIAVLMFNKLSLLATASGSLISLEEASATGEDDMRLYEFEYQRDEAGDFTFWQQHQLRSGLKAVLTADAFSAGIIRLACRLPFSKAK